MFMCDCALAVAALLAMAPISYGLFVRPAMQQRPDFFACDYRVPCGLSAPSVYMGRVLKAGYAKAQAVARAGRKPIIVVVGADNLRNSALWSDKHLYGTILEQIGVSPGQVKMALVEPVQEKHTEIWDQIRHLPIDPNQVKVISAVLDGECKQEHRTIYRISPQAGDDFGFRSSPTQGWTSLEKDHPFNVVDSVARWPSFFCPVGHGNCIKGMRAFAHAANRSSYLVERKVQCMTLQGLLRSTGSDARDVAMLVVDAEEHDTAIIRPMLDDPAFEPGFIMYEGGLNTPRSHSDSELPPKLRARGYSLGSKPGGFGPTAEGLGDAKNIVAVRSQKSQPPRRPLA